MPSFRGYPACSCLVAWLAAYEAELLRKGVIRRSVDIYQLIGSAAASAGTHRRGGCADLVQRSRTAIKISRNMGAAGFDRASMRPPHQHLVLKGCPHAVDSAKAQVGELERRGDGLVGNARDTGPRTGIKWPLRTWKQGIEWAKDQAPKKVKIPTPTRWYVTAQTSYPYTGPSARMPRAKGSVSYRGMLSIRETKVVYGTLWGRTTPGRWWILGGDRASKTRPPAKPKNYRITGHGEISTRNVAAQAQPAHQKSWFDWRALNVVRQLAAGPVDVALLQETGSKRYLEHLDDVLKQHGRGLVRVIGGGRWRHVLRNRNTTKYVDSDLLTLPTRVDRDGNQIAVAVLRIADVLGGFVSFHFDVDATTAQKVQQVHDTVRVATAWFAERGVDPINITWGGDGNNNDGQVLAAFASHDIVSAFSKFRGATNTGFKTNNGWQPGGTKIPRGQVQLDFVGVHEKVAVTAATHYVSPTVPGADHNELRIIRSYYEQEAA